MANAFFSFGLVGLHLARVVCSCGLVASNLMLVLFLMWVRLLFAFGLDGAPLARQCFIFHLAAYI